MTKKVLRVDFARGEEVAAERLFKPDEDVVLEVVGGDSFTLIEVAADGTRTLRITADMGGTVKMGDIPICEGESRGAKFQVIARRKDPVPLEQLREEQRPCEVGGTKCWSFVLREEMEGKIVLGDLTALFSFVLVVAEPSVDLGRAPGRTPAAVPPPPPSFPIVE